MKKIILTLGALVVIAGGATGLMLVNKDNAKSTTQKTQTSQTQQATKSEVSYKGVEGKNALELLKKKYKVETKSYSGLGELATGIDGLRADSKHFWAFYVNGQQSQVGAGSYTTKQSDSIVWKLEEIK